MKITIRNNFHNTEAYVTIRNGNTITGATARRIEKKLCGVSGCKCGGVLGERGPQEFTYDYQLDERFKVVSVTFAVVSK